MFNGPTPELFQIRNGRGILAKKLECGSQRKGRLEAGNRIRIQPLAQFGAGTVNRNGTVRVLRCIQAKRVLNTYLAECGIQQVGTPDDVRDALFGIIQDDGQLIGGQAVGPPDNEISAPISHVFSDAPLDAVMK
jgi:hypothetical protein